MQPHGHQLIADASIPRRTRTTPRRKSADLPVPGWRTDPPGVGPKPTQGPPPDHRPDLLRRRHRSPLTLRRQRAVRSPAYGPRRGPGAGRRPAGPDRRLRRSVGTGRWQSPSWTSSSTQHTSTLGAANTVDVGWPRGVRRSAAGRRQPLERRRPTPRASRLNDPVVITDPQRPPVDPAAQPPIPAAGTTPCRAPNEQR